MFYGNLKNTIQLKQKEKLTMTSSVSTLGLDTLERELQLREKSSTKLLNHIQTLSTLQTTHDTDDLPSPIKHRLDERVINQSKFIERVSSLENLKIRSSNTHEDDIE